MYKTIRVAIALAVVILSMTACKTQQKVTEVPAGANTPAKNVATEKSDENLSESTIKTVSPKSNSTVSSSNSSSYNSYSEPEVTRNENFSLAAGETNVDALKSKYHVVVGSFSKIENAKGLQSTLKNEGNSPVIVVNERGMYRLIISSHNDYNQAHAKIRQIANRFTDAWVLVKK